jgi:hypothetical protein
MCPFGLASLPLNRDALIANDYYPFSSIAWDLNQERAAVYKRIVAARTGACCLASGRDAASKAYPLLMESKAGVLRFCFAVRLTGKPLRTFPDAL